MGNIEEPWEPFVIQVLIEGNIERLLVIPDMDEPEYEIFDEQISIGTVWVENQKQARVWCGEGLVAKELLAQIGEQIDDYINNKPV